MLPAELRTERLLLRRWTEADRAPFAAMNADERVMEFYPSVLSRAESDAFVERVGATFDREGYGLWAVEIAATGEFAGHVGLWPATFPAPFTPAVEVGWRLAAAHWGNGYATEAARRSVEDGFTRLALPEIVSFTAATNLRSRRVMEHLGMTYAASEDFDHPNVPQEHALRRHVLYRLANPASQVSFSAG